MAAAARPRPPGPTASPPRRGVVVVRRRRRRPLRVLLVASLWVVPGALRLRSRDASPSPSDVDLIDAVRASWSSTSFAPRFANGDFDDDLMLRRLRSREDLTDHPLPHFYVHVPKAAGYYAMQTLSELLSASPRMKRRPKAEKFRICNLGAGALVNRPGEHRGVRCTMYMSEKEYTPLARHAYAVVRDPREHVLSQYFHCAESPDHATRYSDMMPSLDEWLETWEYYQQVGYENVTNPRTFGCKYDPTSMQSRYTRFDLGNVSALQRRFTVIGPMDELDRTLCAIFVHYARWVPEACVCAANEDAGRERRRDPEVGSHGVVHHGHSYNTTGYQDALIRRLVEKDSVLYAYVKALFRRQVGVIEREHNVTLCGRIGKIEKK